jgi:hypothetical protein
MFRYSLLVLSLSVTVLSFAQNPANPIVKFKPPVVKSYLSTYTGSDVSVSVEEAKSIISLPLKVLDESKNNYTVNSYQFIYKRIGVVMDDTSGKITPESDIVAQQFTSTPLSSIWINTIKDELHAGEELYFFDIIVKDNQGRLFFAPELKISVK